MQRASGTLFIVSTPIGNLADLSPRAGKTLAAVDYVLCESTSKTAKLVIGVKLIPYFGHGMKGLAQRQQVINDLVSGKDIALVSNAGTPLLSDPGMSLVTAVVEKRLNVVHIPGPVAAISAAVTSGLPTKNLILLGFLSKKSAAITSTLNRGKTALAVLQEPGSLVVYCSKYQLQKTFDCIRDVFGNEVQVSVAREQTKKFEEHFTGTVTQARSWWQTSPKRQLGEFTIVISAAKSLGRAI